MRISSEKIKELQILYKNHFNQDLDESEALDLGNNLVDLFKLIYKPISKGEVIRNSEKHYNER